MRKVHEDFLSNQSIQRKEGVCLMNYNRRAPCSIHLVDSCYFLPDRVLQREDSTMQTESSEEHNWELGNTRRYSLYRCFLGIENSCSCTDKKKTS